MTSPDMQPSEPAGRTASRLSFHLDDVLPLAGHAASSPRHALTRAQLLARAPLMAALALTSAHGDEALISNGEPGWYDANGEPHRARACTWIRRSPTGPTASATVRNGLLPLRSFGDDSLHVIDWLRRAAASGAHWLSIDLSRPRPVISLDQLDVSEQRNDDYPPDAAWAPAAVACVPELGGGQYSALVSAVYRTRGGGEIARFDQETVARIIVDIVVARHAQDRPYGPVLRWDGDRLEVFEQHHAGGIPGLRRYDVVGPDRDGRYPLGAFLWPWLRIDSA